MRIAITSPFGHPHVWRGVERYCRELAAWLGDRGHEVVWVVSSPDLSGPTRQDDGVLIDYRLRGPARRVGPWHLEDSVRAALPIGRGVRAHEADVVECHHFSDAAGTRLVGGAPYLIWVPGVPRQWGRRRRPLQRALFHYAFRGAARLHALSRFAADSLAADFGYQAEVVPPGVDTARYAGDRPATDGPVVLCTAAAGDPRKRVALLVRAFPAVAAAHPEARLVLASGDADAATALVGQLDERLRRRVQVHPHLGFDGLADAYRSATVSVLPSIDEAFGLVMVESLAAGTPVVGTRSGAIPEVLDDERVGRLFRPDDQRSLERALLDAIELGSDPATAAACRQHARRWDWDTVGPQLEATYERLAGR